MIELSNSNAQTLSAGQSAIFDTVLLHTGCAECHRLNSSSIVLTRPNAIYEISYSANIGTTVADGTGELSITINGSPLFETTSIVTTAAGGDLQNVCNSTFIKTCCCETNLSISLTNTGTTILNLAAHPRISIKRLA